MKSILILSSLAFLFSSCKPQETASTSPAGEESSVKPYPLDVCLVSGEKLGSMGDPVVIVHEDQQIKFCCDSCIPKFEKDPAKYLSKLKTP
jgi:PBP1b-binding outer membrane lipoprotein LpoB